MWRYYCQGHYFLVIISFGDTMCGTTHRVVLVFSGGPSRETTDTELKRTKELVFYVNLELPIARGNSPPTMYA